MSSASYKRWSKLAGLLTEDVESQSAVGAGDLHLRPNTRALGGVTAQNAVKQLIAKNNTINLPEDEIFTAKPGSSEPDVYFKGKVSKQHDLEEIVLEAKKGPSATFDTGGMHSKDAEDWWAVVSDVNTLAEKLRHEGMIIVTNESITSLQMCRVSDAGRAAPSPTQLKKLFGDALSSQIPDMTSLEVAQLCILATNKAKAIDRKRVEWDIKLSQFSSGVSAQLNSDPNQPNVDSSVDLAAQGIDERTSWVSWMKDFVDRDYLAGAREALAAAAQEKGAKQITVAEIARIQKTFDSNGSSCFMSVWVKSAGSLGRYYPILVHPKKDYFPAFVDAVIEHWPTFVDAASKHKTTGRKGVLDYVLNPSEAESYAQDVLLGAEESSLDDLEDFQTTVLPTLTDPDSAGQINSALFKKYQKAWRKKRGLKKGQANPMDGVMPVLLGIAAGEIDINDFSSRTIKKIVQDYFAAAGVKPPGKGTLDQFASKVRTHVVRNFTADPNFYSPADAESELNDYGKDSNWKKGQRVKKWKQKNSAISHDRQDPKNRWNWEDLVEPDHPFIEAASKKYSLMRLYEQDEVEEEPQEVLTKTEEEEAEGVESAIEVDIPDESEFQLPQDTLDFFDEIGELLDVAVTEEMDDEELQDEIEMLPE